MSTQHKNTYIMSFHSKLLSALAGIGAGLDINP